MCQAVVVQLPATIPLQREDDGKVDVQQRVWTVMGNRNVVARVAVTILPGPAGVVVAAVVVMVVLRAASYPPKQRRKMPMLLPRLVVVMIVVLLLLPTAQGHQGDQFR